MNPNCSIALLESALEGNLPADDEASLHRHLEECEECSAALERMAGGPDWCREAASFLAADELDEALPTREEWSEADFIVEHLEPADEPHVLGRLGGYDVLEVIGHGGMGVVLKGYDRELKRCVAIKVLAPHLARSSLAKKRFAREAQAAAAVVHPNVLAIHQVQPNGRLPFLVMPLVAGESLAERLTAQGSLELKEVLRIGMQAAAGLAAAHEQGLVHRDVKPANILLEKGIERAVLTDFGLARAADDVALTRWGIIAGTPEYMSPEQARGERLDGRSDLFSLGCVLYQMATGVSPFRADSTLATMRRLVDDPPRALPSLNPELPPWFIAIVDRLLEKDPSRRFGSAEEVGELLETCLAHVQQPNVVPLPSDCSSPSPANPPRRRWPARLFLGAGFVLTILLAGILIVLETDKGTLTIRSDAENVPVRIMQGDKTVEQLTVTRSGESVKIAAGRYQVELLAETDGLTVKDGTFTLTRGKEHVATIERVETVASPGSVPVDAIALSHRVPFEVGATYLRDGDRITIDEVRGTAATMKTGNTYEIRGTYRLASSDSAILAAYITVDGAAGGRLVGWDPKHANSMKINRGEGTFTLFLYMRHEGKPHVSLYPVSGGEGFGHVYFGTGDSVLKEGWWQAGSPGAGGAPGQSLEWSPARITLVSEDFKTLLPAALATPEDLARYKLTLKGYGVGTEKNEPLTATNSSDPFPGFGKSSAATVALTAAWESRVAIGTEGVADFGLVRPGKHELEVETPFGQRFRGAMVVEPGQPFKGGLVCPSRLPEKADVTCSVNWPDDLREKDLWLVVGFAPIPPLDKKLASSPGIMGLWKIEPPAASPQILVIGPGDERIDFTPSDFGLGRYEFGFASPDVGLYGELFSAGGLENGLGFRRGTEGVADLSSPRSLQFAFPVRGVTASLRWSAVEYLMFPLIVIEKPAANDQSQIANVVSGVSFGFDRFNQSPTRDFISFTSLKPSKYEAVTGKVNHWAITLPDELLTAVREQLADSGSKATTPVAIPEHTRHFPTDESVKLVALSPDGKRLAIANGSLTPDVPLRGDWKRRAEILDAETGRRLVALQLTTPDENAVLASTDGVPHFEVEALTFSFDKSVVAVGTGVGQVKLFNAKTGELIRSFDDEQAKLAEKKTPERLKLLQRAMGGVESLAFSPDGSLLAMTGNSFEDAARNWGGVSRLGVLVTGPGRLKIWDVETGTLKHDLVGHSHGNAVAFSPDGKLLASAGSWVGHFDIGGTGILIWDSHTGEKIRTITAEANGGTHTAAFSPDGRLVAFSSVRFDKDNDTSTSSVSVAHTGTGIVQWLQTVPGFANPVAFSADGQSVVVLSSGQSIRLLDTETGTSKGEIRGADFPPGGRWNDFAISTKRPMLATGGIDSEKRGFVTLWDLKAAPGAALPARGEDRVDVAPLDLTTDDLADASRLRRWKYQVALPQPSNGVSVTLHELRRKDDGKWEKKALTAPLSLDKGESFEKVTVAVVVPEEQTGSIGVDVNGYGIRGSAEGVKPSDFSDMYELSKSKNPILVEGCIVLAAEFKNNAATDREEDMLRIIGLEVVAK